MKKDRFSEEQVVAILREGRGMKVSEVCAKHIINNQDLQKMIDRHMEYLIDSLQKKRFFEIS